VLLTVLPACAPEEVDPQTTRTSATIANRNLDVLFMVDNSSSMRLQQANLTTNFPMFMDALKALPGGLPNIHVAVISADMGGGNGVYVYTTSPDAFPFLSLNSSNYWVDVVFSY